MTSTEIGRSQISGRCPYKVLNSQQVPTRPETMRKTLNVTTLHEYYHRQDSYENRSTSLQPGNLFFPTCTFLTYVYQEGPLVLNLQDLLLKVTQQCIYITSLKISFQGSEPVLTRVQKPTLDPGPSQNLRSEKLRNS